MRSKLIVLINPRLNLIINNTKPSVTNLMGLINILEYEPDNKEYFILVKKALDKLNLTIENIGKLLNLENEVERVEQSECSIKTIMEGTLVLNHQLIIEQASDIQIDIPNDLKVKAVTAYLESVFNNLITNAVRYGTTADHKKIQLYTKKEHEKVHVFIKDQGLGINIYKGYLN